MSFKKYIFNKGFVYLFLFALSCIATLFAIKYGNIYLNIFLRVLRFSFLLLYYISLAKKFNITYFGVLVSFLATSILLVYNSSSVYAMLVVCITRLLFIRIVITEVEKINRKPFTFLFFLSAIAGFVTLSLYYNNSAFFYTSILATLLLIVSLVLSFLNVLNTAKKGNLEFFIAIFLIVISDMIFGAKRVTGVDALFLITASVFYNIAYFLITIAVLKKEENINID